MAYLRNEEQHARKLDHIATFSAGVLAAEGPDSLHPLTIGRRIDGTGYNVSNLFRNRASILALVLDRHWDGLLAAAGQPGDWSGEPRDQLLSMATSYLEYVSATRGVHAALARCHFHLHPATRDDYATRRRWLASAFGAVIAEAAPAAAQDPMLCEALSEALLDSLDGWATRPRDGRPDAVTYAGMLVRRTCAEAGDV